MGKIFWDYRRGYYHLSGIERKRVNLGFPGNSSANKQCHKGNRGVLGRENSLAPSHRGIKGGILSRDPLVEQVWNTRKGTRPMGDEAAGLQGQVKGLFKSCHGVRTSVCEPQGATEDI